MRGHFYHMHCCLVTELTHTIFICFQGNQAKKLTKGQILIQKGKEFFLTLCPHHLNSYLTAEPKEPIQCPCEQTRSLVCHIPATSISQNGIIKAQPHPPFCTLPPAPWSLTPCLPLMSSPPPPISCLILQSPSIGSSLMYTLIFINTQEICVILKDYPSPRTTPLRIFWVLPFLTELLWG